MRRLTANNAVNLASSGNLAPTGAITAFAASTAPSGWLLCDGSTVSRTTYVGLFAVIGTSYGTGDGSTTFGLPDLRGRVPAGLDNMGGSAASRLTNTVLTASNTMGASGGAQTHTLTTSQMPSHSHSTTTNWPYNTTLVGASGPYAYYWYASSATVATDSKGGDAAHTNTQPTLVVTYIIKF